MIPKIIHYTWFSEEPFSDEIQKCIDSWKDKMPDYEYIHWDYDKVRNIDSIFLQEALHEKKWAFASDFVRLYVIYHYGGVYLDTDVMVLKSFDSFLNQKCFIGRENSFHLVGREVVSFLTSHCFGAEKGNEFIKENLDYYKNRHFVTSSNSKLPNELRLDMKLLPFIQAIIAKHRGWDWAYNQNDKYSHLEFTIYPTYYFDSIQSEKTFCRHLALGSWRESKINQERVTLKYKVKWRVVFLLEKILNKLGYVIIRSK